MYTKATQNRAQALRRSGRTYDEIARELGTAKSTLSIWLKDVPMPSGSTPEAKKQYFLAHVQAKGAAANHAKKEAMWRELRREAQQAALIYKASDLELATALVSMLYWAEGTKHDKGGLVFTNTDPRLAHLFLTLLRRVYFPDESRLRIRLHLHEYHSQADAVAYWSKLLDIPVVQFQSTYIKKRNPSKKFRQNFMGICFIKYGDSQMRRKVLSYAYAIQKRLAPVAQLD